MENRMEFRRENRREFRMEKKKQCFNKFFIFIKLKKIFLAFYFLNVEITVFFFPHDFPYDFPCEIPYDFPYVFFIVIKNIKIVLKKYVIDNSKIPYDFFVWNF